MATRNSAVENDTATTRSIESGRLTKALTEPMRIEAHAPGMYAITNTEGTTRTVDIEGGACECADAQYRGDEFVCKHVLRAAVVHAFTSESNTQLVARVLAEVRERGCIHDTHGCGGPTARGERGLPCEDCIAATPGHWTVWCRLTGHDEWLDTAADTGEGIATDGGTLTIHDGDAGTTETIESDGGGEGTDNAERMARGERPLPDFVEECQYCGADRDAMRCTDEDSHVAPHSHHGTRHTVISCDECGGAHITVSHVQTRVNRPSRPTHTKSIWDIPEGYLLCVCMDGEIVAAVPKSGRGEEFYVALLDGELNCECGATVTHVEGRFERNADGTPVEPLPEPDH